MLDYAGTAGFALKPRLNWRAYLVPGVLNTAPFGTLWGALFLSEPIGLSTLASGTIIIIASAPMLEVGARRNLRRA
jgi:hypothetical protein